MIILWSSCGYRMTTLSPPSDYPTGTLKLLSDDFLVIFLWPSIDCPMIIPWLSYDFPFYDCPMIMWWLSHDYLLIILWLSYDSPVIQWIPHDHLMSILSLPYDDHMTPSWLPYDYPMVNVWRSLVIAWFPPCVYYAYRGDVLWLFYAYVMMICWWLYGYRMTFL